MGYCVKDNVYDMWKVISYGKWWVGEDFYKVVLYGTLCERLFFYNVDDVRKFMSMRIEESDTMFIKLYSMEYCVKNYFASTLTMYIRWSSMGISEWHVFKVVQYGA